MERMRALAVLDIGGKLLSTVGVFLFVHSPTDGWKVLFMQGFGSLLTVAAGLTVAYQLLPAFLPTRTQVFDSLRMGWTMFVFRSSVSLYTVGNSFILGLFAAPEFVGYFAGAERISRAFIGVFDPVSQAMFPRLSYLVHQARDPARRLLRHSLLLMSTGGILISLSMFVTAPLVVRAILGPSFHPSVSALRILSMLPFLIAVSNVLGIQWMVPLGMDRAFNAIILSAGIINLALAITLAPRYAHLGMAAAAATAELFVVLSMVVWVTKSGLGPFAVAEGELGQAGE